MSFDVSRLTVTSQCFSSLSAKFEIYAIESYSRIKFVKKVVGLQFSLFYKLSGTSVSTKVASLLKIRGGSVFIPSHSLHSKRY